MAGVALICSSDTYSIMMACWGVVAGTILVSDWLLMNGGEDGSHQMLTILSVAFAISLALGFADWLPQAGLYFIGLQACLAYGTSGVAKLISPMWRSGEAIPAILLTRTYGPGSSVGLLQKYPAVAIGSCWMTIAFESAFLFAPLMPQLILISLFATAAIFHIVCAGAMGLNGFFWSFCATYPAILFLNHSVASGVHLY
ncbi:hypothetical protein ACLMAJ_16970 [Nocardia sp. KC 131]|uniref:hypothetical protein n=1 Tax=Nocardia arseniciresistens TaxID=3392119 RepID=UPI00398E8296